MDPSTYQQIEFRRKYWQFLGASITMSDPASGAAIGFIKLKAFRWKDDIRVYSDQSLQTELLRIQARQVITLGATYDVIDSATNVPIISLQRKALRSAFVRDYWKILDGNGNQVGAIQETSSGLALSRRYIEVIPYVGGLLGFALAFTPQTYRITYAGDGTEQVAGTVTHRKNPFIVKMLLDFSSNESTLDKRVGIAATALLSIIDAIKNN